MSQPLTVAQLLERNKAVAQAHAPIPFFSEFKSRGLTPPHILVQLVTCADPRSVPEYYLGLRQNEFGVIVFRNVCGHATQSMSDILSLDRLVTINEIMIIHHNDCGALLFKDEEVRATLKERVGDDKDIDGMKFGAITDVEQSVRDDLAVIASSPYMRKELLEHTKGYVFDIKTGLVKEVES